MYDQRIQLLPHAPAAPALPDPGRERDRVEDRDAAVRPPADTSLTRPTPMTMPHPAMRLRRQAGAEGDEDAQEEEDGSWLLRPVVELSDESIIAEALTGWGWLAEQVVAVQRSRAEGEEGEEDVEADENTILLYGLMFGEEADGMSGGPPESVFTRPTLSSVASPGASFGGWGLPSREEEARSRDTGTDTRAVGRPDVPPLAPDSQRVPEERPANAAEPVLPNGDWGDPVPVRMEGAERFSSAGGSSVPAQWEGLADPMQQLTQPLDPAARSWWAGSEPGGLESRMDRSGGAAGPGSHAEVRSPERLDAWAAAPAPAREFQDPFQNDAWGTSRNGFSQPSSFLPSEDRRRTGWGSGESIMPAPSVRSLDDPFSESSQEPSFRW